MSNSSSNKTPMINSKSFACPHCQTLTHQYWYSLYARAIDLPYIITNEKFEKLKEKEELPKEAVKLFEEQFYLFNSGNVFFEECDDPVTRNEARSLNISKCYTCNKLSVWIYNRLVHPENYEAPLASPDMPNSLLKDFNEARAIFNNSPRGSAALLRLCIQKLCIELGEKGDNLNHDIGKLVKKGLPTEVQQALDSIRVIGNESVHPGQIDLNDDRETAEGLFELVNFIIEKMITEKKQISSIYEKIPENKRKQIEKRDQKSI